MIEPFVEFDSRCRSLVYTLRKLKSARKLRREFHKLKTSLVHGHLTCSRRCFR